MITQFYIHHTLLLPMKEEKTHTGKRFPRELQLPFTPLIVNIKYIIS